MIGSNKTGWVIVAVILIMIMLQTQQEQKTTSIIPDYKPTVGMGQGGNELSGLKQELVISESAKKQASSDINRISGASVSVDFGMLVNKRLLGDGGNTATNAVENTHILDLQNITNPQYETVAFAITLSGQIRNTEPLCAEFTLFRPDGTTKKAFGQSCIGTPQSQNWEWWTWVKLGSVWTGPPHDILTTGPHKLTTNIVSGQTVSGSYDLFFDVIDSNPFVCNAGQKACDVYQGSTWTTECRNNAWVRVEACSEACFSGACTIPDCSSHKSGAVNSINAWISSPTSTNRGNALNAISKWAAAC